MFILVAMPKVPDFTLYIYSLSVFTHSSKHLFQVIQHDTWFTYPLMKEDPAVDMFIVITGVGTNSTGSVDDLVACYGGRLCR